MERGSGVKTKTKGLNFLEKRDKSHHDRVRVDRTHKNPDTARECIKFEKVHIEFRFLLIFSMKYEKMSVEIESLTIMKEEKTRNTCKGKLLSLLLSQ